MIVVVIAAFLIGCSLLAFLAGYALGRTEQSDAARWEINLWKTRCAALERDMHVRRVTR